jgi:hypothetical protein
MNKTIKRELQVAFSKHSQPVWFRVVKYIVLAALLYAFWGSLMLLIIILVLLVFSLSLHFWYRYKTAGWTKSYGLWKYH